MFSRLIEPDFHRIVDVVNNRRADILPMYEHIVSYGVIGKILGVEDLSGQLQSNSEEAYQKYNQFFYDAGYDAVPFEQCVVFAMPPGGAISGGVGPIQDGASLRKFPWNDIPKRYYEMAAPRFEAFARHMPKGMKGYGGVGNGVFELAEDLVGLEYLPFLEMDYPDAYADLYKRIGDLLENVWSRFLHEFDEHFCAYRFGDDLGFRTSLLTSPGTARNNIIPNYRRIIDLVHSHNKPFILHSCGCIFELMDDLIAVGINAKHSNEDIIAPFEIWIEKYSDRIGLLGGIDMDFLVRATPQEIKSVIAEKAPAFYKSANGFAVGCGNSISDYVPIDNYIAMVQTVNEIRGKQAKNQ
jgi:uroporphyrinogen decarboxylase